MTEIEKLRNETRPIFIWGVAVTASQMKLELEAEGIEYEGFATDLPSYEDIGLGKVWVRDAILREFHDYVLIRGFEASFAMTDEDIMNRWPGCAYVYSIDCADRSVVDRITPEYYEAHRADFERVRNGMADQFSKDSVDAFLKTKRERNCRYIQPYVSLPHYFLTPSLWTYSNDDVFLDGGGYDGDSILEFVNLRGDSYSKIITCEPDSANYKKLLKTVECNSIKRVEAVNKGLHSESTTLRFDSRGDMSSSIQENGTLSVDVVSIDDLLGDAPVSIIKLDIEGSEVAALQGARKSIVRNRPILIICAYHKKGDLYKIYDVVNDMVSGYNYYFRIHMPVPLDAILYAVPTERINHGS